MCEQQYQLGRWFILHTETGVVATDNEKWSHQRYLESKLQKDLLVGEMCTMRERPKSKVMPEPEVGKRENLMVEIQKFFFILWHILIGIGVSLPLTHPEIQNFDWDVTCNVHAGHLVKSAKQATALVDLGLRERWNGDMNSYAYIDCI